MRARTSCLRNVTDRARATACSAASPAWCPRRSFSSCTLPTSTKSDLDVGLPAVGDLEQLRSPRRSARGGSWKPVSSSPRDSCKGARSAPRSRARWPGGRRDVVQEGARLCDEPSSARNRRASSRSRRSVRRPGAGAPRRPTDPVRSRSASARSNAGRPGRPGRRGRGGRSPRRQVEQGAGGRVGRGDRPSGVAEEDPVGAVLEQDPVGGDAERPSES